MPFDALTDLNTLRTSGSFTVDTLAGGVIDTTWALGTGQVPAQVSGFAPLTDPGTDAERVSLLFRERAFWLYGTGSRLGDMRRLITRYGTDGFTVNTVYPTGSYQPLYHNNPAIQLPTPTYGTDVDLALPPPSATANPYNEGCTVPVTQP